MRRKELLVYSLPQAWHPRSVGGPEAERVWADAGTVASLFPQDAKLRKRFLKFLQRGCVGCFFVMARQFWASYSWMSVPGTSGPPHMPIARQENAFWIFHCRTQAALRGQGFFKRSLAGLAQRARGQDPEATVFVDTEPENLPSRRAILGAGFQPCGVAAIRTVGIPTVNLWTRATWCADRPHPELALAQSATGCRDRADATECASLQRMEAAHVTHGNDEWRS